MREGEGYVERADVIIVGEMSYARTVDTPRRERRKVDLPVPHARSEGKVRKGLSGGDGVTRKRREGK